MPKAQGSREQPAPATNSGNGQRIARVTRPLMNWRAQNKRFSAASSALPKSLRRWVLPILSGLMLVVAAATQESTQNAAQQRDTAEQHFHSAPTFHLAAHYEKPPPHYPHPTP